MKNYIKIRRIVRAKQGSTIQNEGFPTTLSDPTGGVQLLATQYQAGKYEDALSKKKQNIDGASAMSAAGQAADMLRNFMGVQQKSETTQALNQGYDAIANAAMGFSPVGTIIGGAMKVGGLIGDALTAAGLGTDQMTLTDQILDSNFMKLSPFGVANAALAKSSRTFTKDQETAEQVGGSYGGSMAKIDNAVSKAGKKYGAFSSKSRRKANKQIAEAERQQNIMTDIAEDQRDRIDAASSMIQLANLNYQTDLNGGIDPRYLRAAKQGMKIQDRINLVKSRNLTKQIINVDTKQIEEFKDGGVILNVNWEPVIVKGNTLDDWEPTIESFQDGGKTSKKIRTIEELIEYAKKENPRFIQRMSEPFKDIDLGDGRRGTHLMSWGDDGKGTAFVFAQIQEDENGNLINYGKKALDRAIEKGNYLKMSPEEAELFTNSGVDENGNLYGYKIGWPEFFKSKQKSIGFPKLNEISSKDQSPYGFKQGGKTKQKLETPEIEETNQKNVIPEGALHKNKHHIEHTEGLTQKGIPVVDNEGEQTAEIEHSEIIFTLEVTKKLEELYEDYYDNEASQKDKDEAAIEAGKLLVYQILFNTDDRTSLIDKIQV